MLVAELGHYRHQHFPNAFSLQVGAYCGQVPARIPAKDRPQSHPYCAPTQRERPMRHVVVMEVASGSQKDLGTPEAGGPH